MDKLEMFRQASTEASEMILEAAIKAGMITEELQQTLSKKSR